MSTTLFPVITDARWRAALSRGRAEANVLLAQMREKLSTGAKEAPCHAQLTEISTPRGSGVEQHGQFSPTAGSLADDRSVGDRQATEPRAQAEAGGGDSLSQLNPGAEVASEGRCTTEVVLNAAPGSISTTRLIHGASNSCGGGDAR